MLVTLNKHSSLQEIGTVMSGVGSSRLSVWWRVLKYHFIPPSIFPAVLGSLVAWGANHVFYPFYFFLVLAGVVINHMALNMMDDYFDYKHGVDRLKPEEKNPFSGGSGTVSSGQIQPSAVFKASVLCFLITIAIGLYLTVARGIPVLLFGLFGGFSAVFYTAPPINFSRFGLGELAHLVNFGTIIGLGSYFVQTQKLSLEAFAATLPLGIMLFSMITINEIPDYQERPSGRETDACSKVWKESRSQTLHGQLGLHLLCDSDSRVTQCNPFNGFVGFGLSPVCCYLNPNS